MVYAGVVGERILPQAILPEPNMAQVNIGKLKLHFAVSRPHSDLNA